VKPNDQVVCTDNLACEKSLTLGKVYILQETPNPLYSLFDTVYVINDRGEVGGYLVRRFKKL